MPPILPPSTPSQTTVSVSPLAAGSITLPSASFISPSTPNSRRTVPSLAFLITHPGLSPEQQHHSKIPLPPSSSGPFRMMFDLGLRRAVERYLPLQQKHLRNRVPYTMDPGAAAQLRAGGVEPEEVRAVVLSHVHYDHHGDPEDFGGAVFVVGYGSLEVLEKGLGGRGSHQCFERGLLPAERTVELGAPEEEGWEAIGPFTRALDLLGDGSVYVVDMPGHLPGHVNLLCRLARDRWVCLCGDAYHDKRILTGEKEIGFWEDEKLGRLCIHLDPEMAKRSIESLRTLLGIDGVELIAAHDEKWVEENKDRMFPNVL